MSNSKKTPQPNWLRHPKSQQEKREFGKAKEEGVPVRGKRTPPNLGDLYDDKQIGSNIKKQNKSKKPSRNTIRKGEEDEQSISKQMKATGKATIKGPQVKERKRFAPATKVEAAKKGKGSYKRNKEHDEDEQGLGTVPMKRELSPHEKIKSDLNKKSHTKPSIDYSKLGTVPLRREDPPKTRIQQMDDDMKKRKSMKENTNIIKFIDSILTKNYAYADKYIKQAVESKIQHKIEQELSTPLF